MTARSLVHPRYEPGPLLGTGAQGFVLRVVDREAPERPLVAKVWYPGRFDPGDLAAEFSLLRRVDAVGLVRAHDFGRDEVSGAPFLVEDFIDGGEALAFVQGATHERVACLLTVMSEVTATLSALHAAAFVHGDLKPQHVRVTSAGRIFVLDLGCAMTLARAENVPPPEARGYTRAFAAPEVLAGARPSRVSDLFSLGAVAFYLATGAPPQADVKLRSLAPWVPPSLADVIDRLLAPHPADRPASAEALLELLGVAPLPHSRRAAAAPVGRGRELAQLERANVGVRYVIGPSGSGKSHLLREVVTRVLLAGRPARRVAFPSDDEPLVAKLVAFFRGAEQAFPFEARGDAEHPLLLWLDDFQAAPAELSAALDAYRCRPRVAPHLDVVATAREAPPSADTITIGPLDVGSFAELCASLGETSAARVEELSELSGRLSGWAVASLGQVALTREMVLERSARLSPEACRLLATLALSGGVLSEALLERALSAVESGLHALPELVRAGLLTRRATGGGVAYALPVPELAPDIAAALGSFELSERLTTVLLSSDSVSARLCLTLAGCAFPPNQRALLLERAVTLARRAAAASDEIEALLALLSSEALRSRERLLRLERLTRHAGAVHPQALVWLNEAAARDSSLLPLVLRRQAEAAARAGDLARADELSLAAEAAARESGEPEAIALCLATRGAMALYRADVARADRLLAEAAASLSLLDALDPEEMARLDHNLGVVSLYANRVEEALSAFRRSLAQKRKLGDRAGVRSCLLNLGLALARRSSFDEAAAALDEAIALARSLGQHAGRAWCLAARAELEVRRGQARAAERYVAEALAIAEVPAHVVADLWVVRAQAALLEGDGARAEKTLEAVDPALREQDPLLDARATLVAAGALLSRAPAEPRRAARLCVAVIRRARQAQLPEIEGQARALLQQARQSGDCAGKQRYPAGMDADAELWSLLDRLYQLGREQAPLELLRTARRLAAAERAFLLVVRGSQLRCAYGVDLDGFAVADAAERCDVALGTSAAEGAAPRYLRDVETAGGRGARLALPSEELASRERAVIVLEQRFRAGAFDALPDALSKRLGLLAGLTARLLTEAQGGASADARDGAEIEAEIAQSGTAAGGVTSASTALPPRRARRSFDGIIGASRSLSLALAKLDSAVDSDLPVLVSGETGTGKELFARALHEQGPRAQAPFVALNCGAVPGALFEAELFGHARGAFTGADRARPGLLARAEGGTLLLDEIGELPLDRQAVLLRALETRRFRPLGGDEERPFDVRIVCATNRDLGREVELGRFRRDLLFRINVVEIRVPPLRERPEDIAVLARAFVQRSAAALTILPDALAALESYAWPGNVRELEHLIQRLSISGVSRVDWAHLPRSLRRAPSRAPRAAAASEESEELSERDEVERALLAARGNITHAARALGLTRHGLKKRMLRLGLRARAEGGS